jgi:hypothetical protein
MAGLTQRQVRHLIDAGMKTVHLAKKRIGKKRRVYIPGSEILALLKSGAPATIAKPVTSKIADSLKDFAKCGSWPR